MTPEQIKNAIERSADLIGIAAQRWHARIQPFLIQTTPYTDDDKQRVRVLFAEIDHDTRRRHGLE